jgi:hypothetical protein
VDQPSASYTILFVGSDNRAYKGTATSYAAMQGRVRQLTGDKVPMLLVLQRLAPWFCLTLLPDGTYGQRVF